MVVNVRLYCLNRYITRTEAKEQELTVVLVANYI